MRNIKDYIHFVSVGIWRMSRDSRREKWSLMSILKIVVLSVRLCFKQRLNVQASSLSYYTFFAFIPILAFIIAICRGFGFEDIVFKSFASSFSSSTTDSIIQVVFSMIESYLNHAKGGAFIGIGIILLMWSVYNVFSQVEKSINQIWIVRKSRSLIRRCTDYLSLIILIPFLIVISYGIGYYIQYVISMLGGSWFLSVMLAIKPYFICCLALTFVYILLPNTKVHFSSALLAGVLAGCAVIVFKDIFFWFIKLATSYNAVYGSLAVIPILMLYLRCVWIIILCGAEVSYARQNYEMYEFAEEVKKISPRYQLCIEFYLIKLFSNRIDKQAPFLSFQDILNIYPFPPKLLSVVLKHMCECNLIAEEDDKVRNEIVYVLTTDVAHLTVGNVYSLIQGNGEENFLTISNNEISNIWGIVKDIEGKLASDNKDVLIKDL